MRDQAKMESYSLCEVSKLFSIWLALFIPPWERGKFVKLFVGQVRSSENRNAPKKGVLGVASKRFSLFKFFVTCVP